MSHLVILPLPDELYQPLQRVAQATKQPLESLVLMALQAALPPLNGLPPELIDDLTRLENLDDQALQKVLLGVLPNNQQLELDTLLAKNQSVELNQAEKLRLDSLRHTSDSIMLQKARAAVLLRFRGQRLPTLDELRHLTIADND